jgi:hypothetical protein
MFKPREIAAEYLSSKGIPTTAQGLADKASRGLGPRYAIVNGRAVYTQEWLDAWVAEQAARPVVRRKHRATA